MPQDPSSEDPNRLLVALGQRLRDRRVELGLSQEEVATRSGLLDQQSKISRIELGLVDSQLCTFAKLALGLETDLGTLLAGLPDPHHSTTDRL